MRFRTCSTSEPLERIEEDLAWIETRLAADPHTADLGDALRELLGRARDLELRLRDARLDQIRAEAEVDAADLELDDLVEGLATALRSVFPDADGAQFRRYFNNAPAHVVRLGLASQLAVVRGWPELLAADSEPAVAAGAEPVRKTITRGEAAISARLAAAVRLATLHAADVVPFVEDVNAVLAGLGEALHARAGGRPNGWIGRFFQVRA